MARWIPERVIAWANNTNVLEVGFDYPLTNLSTGEPESNATVSVTIYNVHGVPVPTFTWPLYLSAVACHPGAYSGALAYNMFTAGQEYEAEVIALDDDGNRMSRTFRILAKQRGLSTP